MRKLLFVLAVALGLGLAAPARASVALAMDVDRLTRGSTLVVRGHVASQAATWTRAGRIVTTVKLTVDAALKGQAPTELQVRHLGGHVGNIGQQVEGEVRFTDGEEVVVFLRAHPTVRGVYQVVGMSQGKFHLDRSATTVLATQHLDGLGRVAQPGAAIDDSPGTSLSLPELEQRVTKAAAP
jgi:hypothetical protein